MTFTLEEVREFKWSWEGQTYDLKKESTAENSGDGAENWSLNGNKVTQEKAVSLINAFRFLMIDREPERPQAISGSGAEEDWSLTITLQPEAIDQAQRKETAVTKRYGGYMKEEHMWIMPEGGAWAYPVDESSFNEAIQTWQDDGTQDE